MKYVTVLMIVMFFLSSCEEEDKTENFYDIEYRVGLWVNTDLGDTLEFIDSENLIRRGNVYQYEEYLYRIERDILLIQTLDLTSTTLHEIQSFDGVHVTLGNMYTSIEFLNNSGTYSKSY